MAVFIHPVLLDVITSFVINDELHGGSLEHMIPADMSEDITQKSSTSSGSG